MLVPHIRVATLDNVLGVAPVDAEYCSLTESLQIFNFLHSEGALLLALCSELHFIR